MLGTGGALIQALPQLGDAFYVLYGDSYLPVDYRAVGDAFIRSGHLGLMTVYRNLGRYDTSNVWFEGGEIRVYDKKQKVPQMHHIDYGLGVFRAAAFDGFPRNDVVDLAAVQTTGKIKKPLVTVAGTMDALLPPVVEKVMRRISVLEKQNALQVRLLEELMEALSDDEPQQVQAGRR